MIVPEERHVPIAVADGPNRRQEEQSCRQNPQRHLRVHAEVAVWAMPFAVPVVPISENLPSRLEKSIWYCNYPMICKKVGTTACM
jgi:hypothetical protein